MSGGRNVFSTCEKYCLQELIVKYRLHTTATSGPDSGNLAKKKLAWARLTEEYNSIETNCQRTEAQLKKCWDNLKCRRKKELMEEKRERMKTGGGSFGGGSSNVVLSNEGSAIDAAVMDISADAELQFAIDSDMPNVIVLQGDEDNEETPIIPNVEIVLPNSMRADDPLADSTATPPRDVDHDYSRNEIETGRERRRSRGSRVGSRLSDYGNRTETATRSQIIREEFELRKENLIRKRIREDGIYEIQLEEQKWLAKAAEEKFKTARLEKLRAEYLLEQAKK